MSSGSIGGWLIGRLDERKELWSVNRGIEADRNYFDKGRLKVANLYCRCQRRCSVYCP
jgi:hypothetical protein